MLVETTVESDTHAAIRIEGRFDAFEAEAFRTETERLLKEGHHQLSVNLSDVNFIDSSGLAELVRAMKRARSVDGDVRLFEPSTPVAVILELTRLDAAFDITPAKD